MVTAVSSVWTHMIATTVHVGRDISQHRSSMTVQVRKSILAVPRKHMYLIDIIQTEIFLGNEHFSLCNHINRPMLNFKHIIQTVSKVNNFQKYKILASK